MSTGFSTSDISISFEMSDALMSQAVREECLAFVREHVSWRDVVITAASTALFVAAVTSQSHWFWWLAGMPAVFFAVAGLVWLAAYFWLPRVAKAKIAHLPHRHVQVTASEALLSFQTATERLEVAWSELKSLKRRPNFWIVCLVSGSRIPIPTAVLAAGDVSFFEAKLAALQQLERKAE